MASSDMVDVLSEVPLFNGFNVQELELVASYANLTGIKKGDTLFEEGDRGDYVCFVVSGKLDVLKESDKGEPMVLTTLSRGRSIGEGSIVDDSPRSATVRARTDASMIILSRDAFESILEQFPESGIKLLKGIARLLSLSLRKTSSQLADITAHDE